MARADASKHALFGRPAMAQQVHGVLVGQGEWCMQALATPAAADD